MHVRCRQWQNLPESTRQIKATRQPVSCASRHLYQKIVGSNPDWSPQSFGKDVDWRMIQAVLLLLFALCSLAGFAIACSARASLIPTLILCLAVFLGGLVSDHFLGTRAEEGIFWAKCLYAITPNWQLFWMSDALANDKSIPLAYVLRCGQYAVGTLAISLGMAVLLFEDRELS